MYIEYLGILGTVMPVSEHVILLSSDVHVSDSLESFASSNKGIPLRSGAEITSHLGYVQFAIQVCATLFVFDSDIFEL